VTSPTEVPGESPSAVTGLGRSLSDQLDGAHVAVVGLGRTGRAVVDALATLGARIHVFDSRESSIDTLEPPVVSATVADGLIRVGSIGDSRAYWFGDDGVSWQLTKDDSMAQARMMLGMPREEAERSLQAHSITRWLGRNATDVNPALVELRPDSPGWVVVCSDGLWNYASSPEDLAAVFEGAKQVSGTPVELAESLVAWANSCGGRDNITVALAYCEG